MKRILLVEDEPFICQLYSRALIKAGYDVTVKMNGEQGLAEALTDAYDLVLLDLLVPGISGIEALHKLRSGDKTLRCKIVITTNMDQDEQNRADLERLADGYLIKAEITPKQLVEIVDGMFAQIDLGNKPVIEKPIPGA